MEERHFTEMLDGAPFASLGERELTEARAHAEGCVDCRHALDAARTSSLLLAARAEETFEPSPFFQTRVLAALRERRAAEEWWSFGRLWKSAGALVASMTAAVALLAALTFVAPDAPPSPDDAELAVASNAYSPDGSAADDSILLSDDTATGGVSDGQVLTTLYGQPDDGAK